MSIDTAEINRRFNHHPPDTERMTRHDYVRNGYLVLADAVCRNTPASREQSLAVTALEESLFWANAAIAREGK